MSGWLYQVRVESAVSLCSSLTYPLPVGGEWFTVPRVTSVPIDPVSGWAVSGHHKRPKELELEGEGCWLACVVLFV